MRARTWAIVIVVNVIVSAAVMLTILFLWNRAPDSTTPLPIPTPPVTEEAVSTLPVPTAASPTPPDTLVHTVQAGDTLGAIAQAYGISIGDLMAANGITDPNVLHVGQTLVIPADSPPTPAPGPSAQVPLEPSPTTVPFPTSLPTSTPSSPPLVEIGQVLGSGDLTAEVVIVRNRGGTASLEEWTLSDTEGNTFTFPALTIFTDAEVRVHSVAGSPTPSDLYWGRVTPVWNGGELITLRDRAGNVVDTYVVP
ncbi:MAG: LysM peptidoglycan-binding domain-containing protein [Chloroflexota bacterium]|nr:LysM peptidoglycan-binding domain-containing protein [Chloroflexota bacterium]